MYETDKETIKSLFYEQFSKLTKNSSKQQSFDFQFSDRWSYARIYANSAQNAPL